MTDRRTSITAEARGMRNVFRVEVVGRAGHFTGIRTSLAEARATARHYAELLDAPHTAI